jgi:1-acyl-sn-glycerol-3-phosphate acyltransferase
MLRTIMVALFLGVYTVVVGPPLIVHCIVTGSPELLYRVGVAGARFALRLGGVRIRATGQENIPAGVCVFVGNHTSNIDPPAVVAAIPRRVALLGKKEVFRIPILRRALLLADFVPVDRSNRAAAIASVAQAVAHMKKGVSYLVFPEGTRTPDGRLRPFKKGTFAMAIQAGAPVVPVAVVGAHKLMPKGSNALTPGTVEVHFLPAIDARPFGEEQRDELRRRVQAAIAARLPGDQQPA